LLGFLSETRSTNESPWCRAGVLAGFQHLHAIDEHMRDAGAVLMRLVERRVVLNRLGIEHDDVGVVTRLQRAAPVELHVRGRQRCQAPDPFFEGHQLLIAHIAPEQTRKVSIGARMGVRLQEDAFRSRGFRIRAHSRPARPRAAARASRRRRFAAPRPSAS